MVHTAVTLITLFRDAGLAGEVPDAGKLAILAACFDDALAGKSIDEALGLPPRWFEAQRAEEINGLLAAMGPTSSKAASDKRRELAVYARVRFASDRRRGGAQRPADAGLYRLMTLFGGVVPSAEALRSRERRAKS